ncbi:EAL domain-containing protein [Sulfurimonas sp. SAG-AH-194-L11]|nr:GGDEF and EAL domain-containing protein [Sulfurimonas sp. SAG-AH-194-L11]MDF1877527.1 EAL domain-containing protein [Sulfurimonas sp. SAG-AH-194-L11]
MFIQHLEAFNKNRDRIPEMKLNNKTSIIIITAISFFIINSLVSYKIGLQEEIDSAYKQDDLILKNLFTSQEKYLAVIAKVFTSDSIVLKAYKDNDPQLLQKHIAPIWEKLKSDKLIYEIHFFQPPATSFVNFSNFNSIGEDISKVRTDILWVTSSFKESAHILMCKTYAGYRVTEPIVDENGKMLGGLSLGKKVDWIPNVIKEKTQHDSFLVYYKDAASTLMPEYKRRFFKGKESFREFLLADETIDVTPTDLKNIDFKKSIQNIIIAQEQYTLFSYPIKDFNNNTMGYLCTVTQLEAFKERFYNFSVKEIIMILLTAIIIFYINRRYNKRIIKYIESIKELTNKIKNKDFSYLHTEKELANVNINALLDVEKNIIEMGLVIEKQYTILEDDNSAKTLELIEQLYVDELTQMGNRNALERDLKRYTDAFMSVINIRDFQSINDAFGYEAGNYILQEVAQLYIDNLQKNFVSYRISGDEFAVLNKKQISKEDFISEITNLLKVLQKQHFYYKDVEITINSYAGIVVENHRRLSKANIAMRDAKKRRVEYSLYNKDKDTQAIQMSNIAMVSKLSDALQDDKVVPYFQPILNRDKTIVKYEALVRMIDADKVISPFFFLELSKKTKMYNDITKLMIEKTFACFENSELSFSINITAKDMLNSEIVSLIYKKIKSYKNPKQIIFEIVESDNLYNIAEIELFLQNIREMGAKIAIDDFGTGYSNFSYIMKLKPDYLKIDGSLIKDIDTDDFAYQTVKTILDFSHTLNIRVVAEYIHNEAVFDICLELGVDEFQGYYFGEPRAELL